VRTSNSDKIAKLLGVDCVVIPDTGHGLIEEAAGTVSIHPALPRGEPAFRASIELRHTKLHPHPLLH
jgi:hypothetical protein